MVGFVVLIFSGVGFIPMDEVQGVKHGKDEQLEQCHEGLRVRNFLGWGCTEEVGSSRSPVQHLLRRPGVLL